MADDQTTATAAPAPGIDYSALTPEMINGLIARATQQLPNIQPDQTPVDTSGFWGGLRHGISLLGEFAGSPGPEVLKTLSPAEREQAGFQALSRFGTGLMAASHYVPGQTFGSNLAQGFQAAERGYDTTARQAAGLLGAQQDYAVKNQQADLAKLKEVIPLLQMQANQRAVAGVPYTVGGGGKPGTPPPGTSIATGGSIGGPLLDALANIESGDRNIVSNVDKDSQGKTLAQGGNADEISQGHFQIQTATWRDFAKQAGVDTDQFPTAMSAPRDVQARVASVIPLSRFGPRTQTMLRQQFGPLDGGQTIGALGAARPSAPGQAGPGAPPDAPGQTAMAPVGTQPPNTPVQSPPAALPAPVQTAGPGAPTAVAAPPPAGAPGASIAAPGQTAIAPETGAPVVMPSTPGSGAPVFRYTPSQIPPGLIPSGTFTPDQQQAVKTIQDAYVHERQAALTPADVQKAESNFGTNMTKVLGSQTDAAKVATDALLKFHEADFKQQQDTHAKMLDDYLKQQQADQQQKNELARIAATANEARSTNREQVQNDASRKLVEDNNTETTAARGRVASLEALLELSRNAPDPTLLANKTIGGTPIVDLIKVFGVGGESLQNKASAIQALRSGIANVTKTLRQGVALGNASDADLRFIQAMGPNEMEDNATREAIIGNLLGQQYRQIRFNSEVNKLVSNGVKPGDAMDKANEIVPPVTPVLPKELQNAPRGDAKVAEWFSTNVPANTIWSDANGKRHILHTPDWKPPTAP